MKIYFAGSIRGGRDDKDNYKKIIDQLKEYGVVLTEHIGLASLSDEGQVQFTEEQIYTQDVNWIKESDIVVVEATQPSLGVGYELGLSEALGKRVVCFFNTSSGKSLSAMVRGNNNYEIHDYQVLDEIPNILENIFKKQSD
ncbi:MAG: nucleoside 2-deoxyribosyltransferase [Candidatus Paceibacteria bacterium]|jgi:nucleoside 2-deoxyribosyltransferase